MEILNATPNPYYGLHNKKNPLPTGAHNLLDFFNVASTPTMCHDHNDASRWGVTR